MTMVAKPCCPRNAGTAIAIALTVLLAAACAPMDREPERVQTSQPSVTYKYSTDQELVQAGQNADAYCSRYGSVARSARLGTDTDGAKIAVFECVPAASSALGMPANTNDLAYTYRTDAELLEASAKAQTYCARTGTRPRIAEIITNSDGTKTASFDCVPR